MIQADSLQAAVEALWGRGVTIAERQAVYGGDINRAWRLTLSDGRAVFMKSNSRARLAMFQAEAEGLRALRRPGCIGVPEPLALGTDEGLGESFLLMEHLSAGPRVPDFWERFGHELAALHRADTAGLGGGPYGFGADNFAGSSRQINTPTARWSDFFRDCRLAPQMKMAAGYFDSGGRRQCERLLERLGRLLPEPAFPSLLHGDLWSGNFVTGPDGRAWILDPAAYVGHYEADLAMTELFGGYPPAFYGAYREVNPIDSGYRDRREIYDLYHLLNHLNLFGEAYLGSVQRILDRYG